MPKLLRIRLVTLIVVVLIAGAALGLNLMPSDMMLYETPISYGDVADPKFRHGGLPCVIVVTRAYGWPLTFLFTDNLAIWKNNQLLNVESTAWNGYVKFEVFIWWKLAVNIFLVISVCVFIHLASCVLFGVKSRSKLTP